MNMHVNQIGFCRNRGRFSSVQGLQFLCAFALLSLNVGCEAKTAVAPRDPVVTAPLREFEKKDLLLTHNMVFLWPDTITPTQMKNVMLMGDRIDQLDEQAAPLNRQLQLLREKLASVEESVTEKKREVNRRKSKIKKVKKALVTAEETQDIGLCEQLQAELDTLDQEKEVFEGEIEVLMSNDDYVARDQIEAVRLKGQEEGNQLVSRLADAVILYYPAPSAFSFHVQPSGQIDLSISDWKMDKDEDPKNFSTRSDAGLPATIDHVEYKEKGGEIKFQVYDYYDIDQTRLRAIFSFKIARTKYDAFDDRIYFSGELTQKKFHEDGTYEVHSGAAKLVDRHN